MASKEKTYNPAHKPQFAPAVSKSANGDANKPAETKTVGFQSEGVTDNDIFELPGSDWQLLGFLTVVAAAVRLFRIYQPSSVVFDEVQYVAPTHLTVNTNSSQLRWFRVEIHQGQVFHGCASSTRQTVDYTGWLARRIRWRF
jgi:hypothetical protein